MIDREALKAQQVALQELGYYKGEIDGIWSRKSIEAKLAFERSGKFNPGIPNNGLPFNVKVRLPLLMKIDSNGYVSLKNRPEPKQLEITTTPAPVAQPLPKKVESKGTEVTVDLKDLT